MYACMYVCMYVPLHGCMFIYIYIYIYAYMHITHIRICIELVWHISQDQRPAIEGAPISRLPEQVCSGGWRLLLCCAGAHKSNFRPRCFCMVFEGFKVPGVSTYHPASEQFVTLSAESKW